MLKRMCLVTALLLALSANGMAAALPPLVVTDTVTLGSGAKGGGIGISYPRTNFPILNDALDEVFNQYFSELLEEKKQDPTFGYSIDYQGTEYSSRLAVIYGFGACWGGGNPPYQFLGNVIVWDKEKNEQIAITDIFEDPDCLGGLEEIRVTGDDGAEGQEENIPLAGIELTGIMIPTADGILICSDYSGAHGYHCRAAAPGALDLCPVKPEYR